MIPNDHSLMFSLANVLGKSQKYKVCKMQRKVTSVSPLRVLSSGCHSYFHSETNSSKVGVGAHNNLVIRAFTSVFVSWFQPTKTMDPAHSSSGNWQHAAVPAAEEARPGPVACHVQFIVFAAAEVASPGF